MKNDELTELLESTLEELTSKEQTYTEVIAHLAHKKVLEEKFQTTLDMNEDFIIEASGGESEDYENVSVDMKQAIYDVMVELHEIISVQDQLKLPN